MAAEGGRSGPDLIHELLSYPEQFEFFQAVRLIERAVREQHHIDPPVSPVGGDEGPQLEPVRFRALPSLTFPAGQIASLKVPASRKLQDTQSANTVPETDEKDLAWPVEMTVPFMGLTGPGGVLPEHYTSLVIERTHLRTKDYTLKEFFDLFNHRAISLFYRAWEKYRFPFTYERRMLEGSLADDLFTSCLFCLVGIGHRSLHDRFIFDDHAILYYGGLFAARTRNARSLEQLLSHYFGFKAQVIQFCGQWLYLPEDSQTCTPSRQYRGGLNCALGENTVVGSQVWDVQSRIRISIGPLKWSEFKSLLPGRDRLAAVSEMIRFYIGISLDFDIQLILRREDVPLCQIGARPGYEPRLGWTTWVGKSEESVADIGDAVFRFQLCDFETGNLRNP